MPCWIGSGDIMQEPNLGAWSGLSCRGAFIGALGAVKCDANQEEDTICYEAHLIDALGTPISGYLVKRVGIPVGLWKGCNYLANNFDG